MKGAGTLTKVSSRGNSCNQSKGSLHQSTAMPQHSPVQQDQQGDKLATPSKRSRPHGFLFHLVSASLAIPLRLFSHGRQSKANMASPRRLLRDYSKNSNMHFDDRCTVSWSQLLLVLLLACASIWCCYVGSHVAIQIHWVDEEGGTRSAIELFSFNEDRLGSTTKSQELPMQDGGPPPLRALQEEEQPKDNIQPLSKQIPSQWRPLDNKEEKQLQNDVASDSGSSHSSEQSSSLPGKESPQNLAKDSSAAKPPYAVSEQMRRQACTIQAQRRVKEMQEAWRKRVVPLLTSAILSPPERDVSDQQEEWKFHIFFNIRYMKKQKKDFFLKRDRMDWYCDDQLGHIVGSQPGDPEGVTVILVCPQRPSDDETSLIKRVNLQSYGDTRKGQDKARTRRVQTYEVFDLVQCAWKERDSEYVPPPSSPPFNERTKPKYAACPILWGPESVPRLLQWVAYNRLIGFDHFFVYLHEPWDESRAHLFPSAPYITYRIFDVDGVAVKRGGGATEKNYYQPIQQTECIYKARTFAGGTIDWVAIMDIDEYFQVVVRQRPTNVPANRPILSWVLDPLEERVKAGNFAGVMIKNWFWGAPRIDGAEGEVVENPPPLVEHEFLLEYVHRAPRWTQRYREKNIVHPWNVRYYAMHTITEGLSRAVIKDNNENGKDAKLRVPQDQQEAPPLSWHIQSGGEIKIGPHHLVLRPARQMRMSHFKEPSRGVYHYKANELQLADVKFDTTLRDAFLEDVKASVAKMEFYD